MISTFHPCLLFCDSDKWNDEEYKDLFISNLIDHIEFINKSSMKIAWSNDVFCTFWNNVPWKGDTFFEPQISQFLYPKMGNLWKYFDNYPENECATSTVICGNYSPLAVKSWLLLVHKLLHLKEETIVVIGFDAENNINRITFSCNCYPLNYQGECLVISKPSEWFLKLDYIDICPKELDEWESCFKLVIEMCLKQDFERRPLKTPLSNVSFSKDFKKHFLNLQKGDKKKIIKSIAKLLTLNHNEAGIDGGLQEEFIDGEYRIRLSKGSRIHYTEKENIKLFLRYIPASKHDSVL